VWGPEYRVAWISITIMPRGYAERRSRMMRSRGSVPIAESIRAQSAMSAFRVSSFLHHRKTGSAVLTCSAAAPGSRTRAAAGRSSRTTFAALHDVEGIKLLFDPVGPAERAILYQSLRVFLDSAPDLKLVLAVFTKKVVCGHTCYLRLLPAQTSISDILLGVRWACVFNSFHELI
jgi:hypothetical protein